MLKLFGSFFIILGCGGVAYSKLINCKKRIELLDSIEKLLYKGIYTLLGQQQNVIVFFKTVNCGDDALNNELAKLGRALEQHLYPNGSVAWRECTGKFFKLYGFREEDFVTISNCGEAFFEKNQEEILNGLKRNLNLMKLIREYEIKQQNDMRKVWIPISVLGGIVFALLFV